MTGYNTFKSFLVEHGIKQDEVADMIGMSRSQLNMILNGQRGNDFKMNEVVTICKHYGISADRYFMKD